MSPLAIMALVAILLSRRAQAAAPGLAPGGRHVHPGAVVWRLVAGERAQEPLDRVRHWIAGHTAALNAALILVIAVLQLQKGFSALVS